MVLRLPIVQRRSYRRGAFMKKDTATTLMIGLLIAVAFIGAYNSYAINTISVPAAGSAAQPVAQQTALQGPDIIPRGVPAAYGVELGVSYDDVSADDQQRADATIRKLGQLDVSITLDAAQKERFINIAYRMENGISCEYCCGARSVIFENGDPACGCAHSYAMRGVAKYIITQHGDEFTDAQILEEMGKWKVLFFPGIMTQKAAVLQANGVELNYINIASNKYRGAEKGATQGSGGQMVGGC